MEEYQQTENKFCDIIEAQKLNIDISKVHEDLDWLHRQEITLQRINENDCNGHPRMKIEVRDGKTYRFEVEDEEWTARDAKKEAAIQSRIIERLKPYGIEVRFNGDPRGGAIRMLMPDHKTNGWDGETWGIYW